MKTLLLLVLAVLSSSHTPARQGKHAEAPDGYARESLEGWTVYVSDVLAKEHPELHRETRRLLEFKLYELERVVPAEIVERLRDVPVWLEYEARDPGGVYHPSRRWLVEHDYVPEKARCVELGNARNFLAWTHHQPEMIVHEMMHAYHHQVLGYDHAGILAAFDKAVAGGRYAKVLRYDGSTQPHYALSNAKEYFAELCEAWFGTNDFYPFVRAELRQHDPAGYALCAELFGD